MTADTEDPDREGESTAPAKRHVSVHWFRQDLRLHDNVALTAAIQECETLYLVFILDGAVASSQNSGYNRVKFMADALRDIDNSVKKKYAGRVHFFVGDPVDIFKRQFAVWNVTRLTIEAEVEPIWQERDGAVKELCALMNVELVEKVGHTLWDPKEVIAANGGIPPLTFSIFNLVVTSLALPPRPLEDTDLSKVKLPVSSDHDKLYGLPKDDVLFAGHDKDSQLAAELSFNKWEGGEEAALLLLKCRLIEEEIAFRNGYVLPNQYKPDLVGPPRSMSAHLKFGCLSIRLFYWSIHDIYKSVYEGRMPPLGITGQLIWREYFYTMAVPNPNYGQIVGNPICVPIKWYENKESLELFRTGQTGYPWIDAIMNQLRAEGWIHHVCRHLVACFLTRGDLWLSWEEGLRIFERYLIDYDWSICAGNWMWVSSSAFEKALDCPNCYDPVRYGVRMDPTGEYVRRYVPVLRRLPLRYLFQPWLAPRAVQEQAGCVIGRDYPSRLCDHREVSRRNAESMERLRSLLAARTTPHCAPSDDAELRRFVWLPERMASGAHCSGDDLCSGIEGL